MSRGRRGRGTVPSRAIPWGVVLSLLWVATPRAGWAQAFPADDGWYALPCKEGPMTDPHRDENGAHNERDIVGDLAAPAGMHGADTSFLYLRMRLDDDPAPGSKPRPFAWGFALDVDADPSTYEVLIAFDGNAGLVRLYQNTQTTLPDDPNDPADEPPVKEYSFDSHGESAVAAGSAYGGSSDHFLQLAVPWSDLDPLGVGPLTPLRVWAASSSNANSLNGDIACHDGSAGGGASLSDIAGGSIVLDPAVDTDGDGFTDRVETAAGSDPNDQTSVPDSGGGGGGGGGSLTGTLVMQGAGGCAVGRTAKWPDLLGWLMALGMALLTRRRRAHFFAPRSGWWYK